MTEIIRIDSYKAEIENGSIVVYAIKGKQKFRMPDCYKEFYDNEHLAIKERTVKQPELFDLPEEAATHYIPLHTGAAE